ncbi:MAG: hypothetical protein KDB01_23745 [Planctomycetaceae bacterium]|nr:hypothetical protein [Planctomycetaceae bacterium]
MSFSGEHVHGGIHAASSRHPNYETCIAMLTLTPANQDGRYDSVIKKGGKPVTSLECRRPEKHVYYATNCMRSTEFVFPVDMLAPPTTRTQPSCVVS